MKIGIIGAGNIGATLARKFVVAGHLVKLAAAKGPEKIKEQAEEIGALPVTSKDAVKDVEVVVLAIPFGKMADVAELFDGIPSDVIVIDASNYYPQRDGRIAEVDAGKPDSVWVSEQLSRPVVKAFNAALAHTLAERGLPEGSANRIGIPVAGDDEHGRRIVQELVNQAGFDPVDAGDLIGSWRQQPGTPAYCTELSIADLQQALARADRSRAPKVRDALMEEFMGGDTPPSHEAAVARNRAETA